MATSADFAAAYCRRYNIALVPLPPRTKRPLADDWGKNVITDPDVAHAFFTKNPDWNMGAALGPSRLCSLDVDDIEATQAIFDEFGWDLSAIRDGFPTIRGKDNGFRVMFSVPEGVQLPYHALTWPKKEGNGRFSVFEIRAAHDQQRQDVLPPSIHPDTERPYIWLTRPNGQFPEPPAFLLQLWRNWDALKPQLQAVCPWAPKPAPKKPSKPVTPRDGGSVIDAYNGAHDVTTLLEQYGYKRSGKRYLSPHSGTGLPGVSVFDENKCWIHHASDPLCSDDSGQPVAPFDLYCCYEHGGDVRKAVKAAAGMMGMHRQAPAPRVQVPTGIDPETGEILAPTAAPVASVPAPTPGSVPRFQVSIAYGLEAKDSGEPYPTVANIARVLNADPYLAKQIWFDEFLQRICTVWGGGPVREWSDIDDINLQIYLQETLGMIRLGKATVCDAVQAVAYQDVRNEAAAFVNGLAWDGIDRLDSFFPDCYGTEDTHYTRAAGLNFWLSMVARVINPGCKVDTMIILEGGQGAGKSKSLAIIGGKWFSEAHENPSSKDFYLNLCGKMLVEIGEMDAFNKAEVTKVKQVITCQTDRYRNPYDKRSADHPRRCVFAGTTNRDDWNKDETGARRFWPIRCVEIRHDLIAENRDQFFAEAVARLRAGGDWWTMPDDDTKRQQEARRDYDELEPVVDQWLSGKNIVTAHEIMTDLMQTPLDRQDKQLQHRLGKVLRAVGWKRPDAPRHYNGKTQRVWVRAGSAADVGKVVGIEPEKPF